MIFFLSGKTAMTVGYFLTIPLSLLAVVCFGQPQSLNDVCTPHGPDYVGHPTDCSKFIQCSNGDSGRVVGEIQNCPFSTYWSAEVLTCLPAQLIKCRMDSCANKQNGFIRSGYVKCREFWECYNGRSFPKCCPAHQRLDESLRCIDNINAAFIKCKDSCPGDKYEAINETANETLVCNKSPILKEPGYYIEVAGREEFIRPCAPGTIFDSAICDCVIAKEAVKLPNCKHEFYLPFTSDHSDMSNNHNFVGNRNVFVKNDSAHFNGVNSRLSIPFFNNKQGVDSIVIRINYTSGSGKGGYPQIILSNSGCGVLPSIVIAEYETYIRFEIGTGDHSMASVSVPQSDLFKGNKIVEFKFLNSTLTGTVNGLSDKVAVGDTLSNVQCDLSIGSVPVYSNRQLKDIANFRGTVNELSIYLCDPERNLL